MACHTQKEIGEAVGLSDRQVGNEVSEITASLPKIGKVPAEFADDFRVGGQGAPPCLAAIASLMAMLVAQEAVRQPHPVRLQSAVANNRVAIRGIIALHRHGI